MRGTLNLDEIDIHLLDLLQHDSGRTLRELGTEVGLTPSAVQRRIARHRAAGVISRQVTVLDPHRLGPTVLATVMVTLRRESVEHHRVFADRMRQTREVQQCYAVSGPWDYFVVLAADSARELGQLGDHLFNSDDNVQRFETSIVFDTVKAGLAIPLRGND